MDSYFELLWWCTSEEQPNNLFQQPRYSHRQHLDDIDRNGLVNSARNSLFEYSIDLFVEQLFEWGDAEFRCRGYVLGLGKSER